VPPPRTRPQENRKDAGKESVPPSDPTAKHAKTEPPAPRYYRTPKDLNPCNDRIRPEAEAANPDEYVSPLRPRSSTEPSAFDNKRATVQQRRAP